MSLLGIVIVLVVFKWCNITSMFWLSYLQLNIIAIDLNKKKRIFNSYFNANYLEEFMCNWYVYKIKWILNVLFFQKNCVISESHITYKWSANFLHYNSLCKSKFLGIIVLSNHVTRILK